MPAYWITTAISIWLMGPPIEWHAVLGSYLFIPYRQSNTNIVPLHGVGWTLNFEMFFYAVFAVAIIWPRKIAVSGLCIVLCCIVVAGYWLQPSFVPFLFWSDPIILEFAAGMLIAVGHRSGIHLPIVLRGCLVGGALFAIWYVPEHMPPSGHRFVVWGLPAAVLVACAVLGRRSVPSPPWLTGPVKLLGDASYALYLIHPLMGAVVLFLWPKGLNQFPSVPVLLVTGVFAQAIALGVFVLLERACTRAMVNLAKRHQRKPPIVAPSRVEPVTATAPASAAMWQREAAG